MAPKGLFLLASGLGALCLESQLVRVDIRSYVCMFLYVFVGVGGCDSELMSLFAPTFKMTYVCSLI